MRIEVITSLQNSKIKELALLQQKSSERRSRGLFIVEGRRELEHCIDSGFAVDTIFYCPEIFGKDCGGFAFPQDAKIVEISRPVYEKVAYRDSTEGIIAEIREKKLSLDDIRLGEHPLVIVLEKVEKPGNLGAVLRSADAAGADAVIICDPLTDLYNPNIVRASIGAVFTCQTVCASSEETLAWIRANSMKIYTAQLQDSSLYYDTDMTGGTAIIMGTESTGLTDFWRKAADAHIRIPMLGQLDSLNVSVSAAILLFEAVRQRNA